MDGNTANTAWRPKPEQNAKALRSFRDSMDDIRDVLEFRPDVSLSVDYIRNGGRRASVELRKLLLDGRPLVHRVLQGPRFQPLRNKAGLTGDVYENSFTMQVAPGTRNAPDFALVAAHTWCITVHPLHGLRFESQAEQWVFEPLFDAQAPPLVLGTWLNQTLFRVDQRVYTLGDTLKFVANKEAVHVDIDRDERTIDMERVHFGHTTYPHLVAFLVAGRLLERYRVSRTETAELWGKFHSMGGEAVPEYKIICGGDFTAANIYPPGFHGEFHETGLQVPEAGRVWNPVRIREHATVSP